MCSLRALGAQESSERFLNRTRYLAHVKDNVESIDAQSDAAGRDEDACVIGYKMSVENYDVSRILSEGVGAVQT
jgi:hypothetical protein